MTIKSAIAAACMAAFVSAGSWASAQVDAQLKPEDLATRQLKVAAAAHKSSEAGVEVFLRKEGNATKVVSWRYRRPSSFSRYTLNKSGNELDLHLASGRHAGTVCGAGTVAAFPRRIGQPAAPGVQGWQARSPEWP